MEEKKKKKQPEQAPGMQKRIPVSLVEIYGSLHSHSISELS